MTETHKCVRPPQINQILSFSFVCRVFFKKRKTEKMFKQNLISIYPECYYMISYDFNNANFTPKPFQKFILHNQNGKVMDPIDYPFLEFLHNSNIFVLSYLDRAINSSHELFCGYILEKWHAYSLIKFIPNMIMMEILGTNFK